MQIKISVENKPYKELGNYLLRNIPQDTIIVKRESDKNLKCFYNPELGEYI